MRPWLLAEVVPCSGCSHRKGTWCRWELVSECVLHHTHSWLLDRTASGCIEWRRLEAFNIWSRSYSHWLNGCLDDVTDSRAFKKNSLKILLLVRACSWLLYVTHGGCVEWHLIFFPYRPRLTFHAAYYFCTQLLYNLLLIINDTTTTTIPRPRSIFQPRDWLSPKFWPPGWSQEQNSGLQTKPKLKQS